MPHALALAAIALGFAMVLLTMRWLRVPAPVPDHAAPFVASHPMLFAGRGELEQVVAPRRDGLTAIDLLISAEEPGLPGDIEVRLLELPARREVRRSRLLASATPSGTAWTIRPGQPGEHWLSFGFEPIPDSSAHEYAVLLAYPIGQDVPGQRLATLAHFPTTYGPGALAVNGFPQNGTILFRLTWAGTRQDAIGVALHNLAREQPFSPGTLLVPGILSAAWALGIVGVGLRLAGTR